MSKKTVSCTLLCALILSSMTLLAQDQTYFSAALWEVPRSHWADYVSWFNTYRKPALEELLSKGTINEWGLDMEGLHSSDSFSHISWMSADSMAQLEEAADALQEAVPSAARAEMAELVTRHRDDYGAAVFSGTRASNLTQGYWLGSTIQVKQGHGEDYRLAWEAWVKPVYDQLLADGTIVSYSLSRQHYHTDSPGLMTTWYAIENMAADEKVEAAFEAAWGKLGEADRKARQALFRSATEAGSHRDLMNRVVHLQSR